MQHPTTDIGSSDPHRGEKEHPHQGEKEHIASVHIPLMIGTEASHGPEILASEDNLASHVHVDGNDNM